MDTPRNSDQFYLDAYSGKGGFLTGEYLVRFARESAGNFRNRQAVSVYANYVAKVLGIYSGFLFKQDPVRETTPLFDEFAANANGAHTSLNLLMQMNQRLAMLVGTIFIVVDKAKDPATTAAGDKLPYLATRLPSQVINYKMGLTGELDSITFSEFYRTSPWSFKLQYRTFNREGWVISNGFNQTGPDEVTAQGLYDLGRVPVVRLHSTLPLLPTDLLAKPWAHDLAQLNWDLYNKNSEMRWLERAQTFALLMLPAKDTTERERLSKLVIGPNNALAYDPAEGGKPDYLAPPPTPLQAYQDAIDTIIRQMYALVNLEFVAGSSAGGGGKGARSGVSLAFEFQQCNNSMSTLAMLTEQAEQEIAPIVHAWQNRQWNGTIAYNREFNLSDLQQELQQGMDALTMSISPTFDQQLKKRLARQTLGHGTPPEVMTQIDAEIESGADPYGKRIAGAAAGTDTGGQQDGTGVEVIA